jgi:hypothetical protein
MKKVRFSINIILILMKINIGSFNLTEQFLINKKSQFYLTKVV